MILAVPVIIPLCCAIVFDSSADQQVFGSAEPCCAPIGVPSAAHQESRK